MDRLRPLLRPRWIVALLIALVVAVVCIRLGFWQLDRLEARRAYNRTVETAMAAPPVPLSQLLTDGTRPEAEALAYRRVVTRGTYEPEREVILFGRPLDGAPGNHVLTPLVTPDAGVIVVDRGWVPIEMDTPPAGGAPPPAGEVEVTGFLLPPEATGTDGPADGPVPDVNLDLIEARRDIDVAPVYLRLSAQSPEGGALPRPAPPAPLGEGPHLGYAAQWFIFGAIALIGYVVLARRELRDEEEATSETGEPER